MKKVISGLALSLLLLPSFGYAMSTDVFLNKLAQCESGGRADIRIVDSNGYYSYGLYQYQLATFMAYGKKYDILPDDFTENEARLLIYNPKVQTELTRLMYEDGLAYHWRNCSKSIGVL